MKSNAIIREVKVYYEYVGEMGNFLWNLEVIVDQFTWMPWISEATIIPEMCWLKYLTVFPEPITLGGMVIVPERNQGPLRRNYLIIRKKISAENYLSAIQKVFYRVGEVLDLLSVVTSRGFRIHRVRPAKKIRYKLGLNSERGLAERIIRYLLKFFSPKPIKKLSMKGRKGAVTYLTAYKEYLAVSEAEGYLEENVIFTTDFPVEEISEIKIELLRIDEFKIRLKKAQEIEKMKNFKELLPAVRFYRRALQMNDYIVRFVLQWTSLESAMQVPRRLAGKKKIRFMNSKLAKIIQSENRVKLENILKKLNKTRNKIVHRPSYAIRRNFRNELPGLLVKLDWILYNYLLYRLGLPLLPKVSSPLKD